MKLDKKALENLQNMNDAQLKNMINMLAAENGLDLSAINISSKDIQAIRNALSGVSDADVTRAADQLSRLRGGGK